MLVTCPVASTKVESFLTLSPPIKLPSAIFLVCFDFQSASMSLNACKILSDCQTAGIRMRRRVTRRLIRIQAVCIWHYSCAWRLMVNIYISRHTMIPYLISLNITFTERHHILYLNQILLCEKGVSAR